MNLKIDADDEFNESIKETLPVPCSPSMKASFDELKRKCGKHAVNRKIRKALQDVIEQNKDKLKAS